MEQESANTLKMKNTGAVELNSTPFDLLSKTTIRSSLFIAVGAVLISVFWSPLVQLLWQVSRTELNSHIPLLPFVSAYLLWIQRSKLSSLWDYRVPLAAIFAALGFGTILFGQTDLSHHLTQHEGDLLSLKILAFVSLSAALILFILGKANLRQAIFPVGFLFLMVPLPETVVRWLTAFLQHASADAAHVLIGITRMPVFREGLVFSLPGVGSPGTELEFAL